MTRLALVLLLLAAAAVAQPRIIDVAPTARPERPGGGGGSGEVVSGPASEPRGVVHLRGLDTLDGETEDVEVAAGQTVALGYLEITATECRVPASDPEGDAWALLSIRDTREAEPRFEGWMFASSPALSALDHPRYDVWVLSCSNR